MTRGKELCNVLKEIRKKIAIANNIPFETTLCTVQEECTGTCPKCEAEMIYLNSEIDKKIKHNEQVNIMGLCELAPLSQDKTISQLSVTKKAVKNNVYL